MRVTFSRDKLIIVLPIIRWQLNCHPFWYDLTLIFVLNKMRLTFSGHKSLTFLPVIRWDNLTLILVLKQYEVNIFQ